MLKRRRSIQAGEKSGTNRNLRKFNTEKCKVLHLERTSLQQHRLGTVSGAALWEGPGDPSGSWAWDCRNAGIRGATSILYCWNNSRTRTSRKSIITLYSALITSHLDTLFSLGRPNAGKTSINWRGFRGSHSDGGGWTTLMWGGAGGFELVHSGAAMGSETWQQPPVPTAELLNWLNKSGLHTAVQYSKMRNNGHKEKQKLRLDIRRRFFSPWGLSSHGRGHQERMCSLHPWKFSRLNCINSGANWSDLTADSEVPSNLNYPVFLWF